jgi:hypothetical protein
VLLLTLGSFTALTTPLGGCEKPPSTGAANGVTDLTWEPRFARLPDDLQLLVTLGEEYLGHLQMMEAADQSRGETVQALRQGLVAAQPQIESVMTAASELQGAMPELRWADDSEVHSGAHLDKARARIMNNARMLRADAVRLWEAGEDAQAWRRLLGAAQVSQYLLDQPGRQHQLLGSMLHYPTLYTAEAMCKERAPNQHGAESAKFLASMLVLYEQESTEEPKFHQAMAMVRAALQE